MPPVTTRRHTLLLLAFAAAGCSVLPERPYVEVRRYALSPQRSAPPRRGGNKVLLLRALREGAGLDRRGLKVVRPGGSQEFDFYNEWVALPTEATEEALRSWLVESRLFSAVTAPGSRARADLILEGELTTLIADIPARQARAALSVVLLSERGEVLAQLTPTGTAPLNVRPDGTVPPEELAEAMTTALGNAFAELERALARYA